MVKLSTIKRWQEECKLVGYFFGALTAATTFFIKLFHEEFVAKAESSPLTAVREDAVAMSASSSTIDWILLISAILFVVFLVLAVRLTIRLIRKRKCQMDGVL